MTKIRRIGLRIQIDNISALSKSPPPQDIDPLILYTGPCPILSGKSQAKGTVCIYELLSLELDQLGRHRAGNFEES
ncbi:hypothetical protein LENED_008292 [Lentinula edodes]|uniref:Uncharacterized protein n=1 Tax=Lentinula edodes TaxID=5353 RepID=A0A1Q3EGL8_LENED|nr:hypothetical protein LENED_008292 [Lentinula edodes]